MKTQDIPFYEMSYGAKKECVRDYLGSTIDNESLIKAISETLRFDQYARVAKILYKTDPEFRKFVDPDRFPFIPIDIDYVRDPLKQEGMYRYATRQFETYGDGIDFAPDGGACGYIIVSPKESKEIANDPTFEGFFFRNFDSHELIGVLTSDDNYYQFIENEVM